MPKNLLISTLKQLFTLSSAGEPPCFVQLCEQLALPALVVSEALDQLETRGLVDAERLRLTMRGLAIAVSLGARVVSADESQSLVSRAA